MRSRTLLEAAEGEHEDEALKDILLEQCFRLQKRAISLDFSAKASKIQSDPQAS